VVGGSCGAAWFCSGGVSAVLMRARGVRVHGVLFHGCGCAAGILKLFPVAECWWFWRRRGGLVEFWGVVCARVWGFE